MVKSVVGKCNERATDLPPLSVTYSLQSLTSQDFPQFPTLARKASAGCGIQIAPVAIHYVPPVLMPDRGGIGASVLQNVGKIGRDFDLNSGGGGGGGGGGHWSGVFDLSTIGHREPIPPVQTLRESGGI